MGGNKRRAKIKGCKTELPAGALRVLLTSDQDWLHDDLLQDCPATVDASPRPDNSEQLQDKDQQTQSSQLMLESWSQLPQLISWFATYILLPDKNAKLSFAPCLPKDYRAEVHTLIQSKFKQCCASVSEGFGDERYVAVVAKEAAATSRRIPQQQADHALALWLLYKDDNKKQQQQQQQGLQQENQQHLKVAQQQQQHMPIGTCQGSHQQCHPQSQQQTTPNSVAKQSGASCEASEKDGSCDNGAEIASVISAPSSSQAAADLGNQHEYSRDEIAQMLMQDKLTADLSALWLGPAGVAQRWSRDICLAASAGDIQDVQALLAAEPDLLAQNIPDLSSGGQLPLHLAAAGGAVDVLRLLLAAGVDVEAKNGAGETAL